MESVCGRRGVRVCLVLVLLVLAAVWVQTSSGRSVGVFPRSYQGRATSSNGFKFRVAVALRATPTLKLRPGVDACCWDVTGTKAGWIRTTVRNLTPGRSLNVLPVGDQAVSVVVTAYWKVRGGFASNGFTFHYFGANGWYQTPDGSGVVVPPRGSRVLPPIKGLSLPPLGLDMTKRDLSKVRVAMRSKPTYVLVSADDGALDGDWSGDCSLDPVMIFTGSGKRVGLGKCGAIARAVRGQ